MLTIRIHLSGKDEHDFRQMMAQEQRSGQNLASLMVTDVLRQFNGNNGRIWGVKNDTDTTPLDDNGTEDESPF